MKVSEKVRPFITTNLSRKFIQRIWIFLEICRLFLFGIFIYIEQLLKWILPQKTKSLNGEVILITGSAGGLGQEICKQLVTFSAKIVLWDISTDANKETAQLLRNLGAKHVFEDTVDITDRDQLQMAAERVRRTMGDVTILVNNAGIAPIHEFLDLNPTAIRKTFEVNVISHFWTIQEFLPKMIENKCGHIVTIASTMSHATCRGSIPYFASKHSVHGLIECLKDELASKGHDYVKFTTAYPFFIRTSLVQGFKLKFRFPFITPFLDASNVAKEVVGGIRSENELLPTRLHRAIADFLVEEFVSPSPAAKVVLKNNSVVGDVGGWLVGA